MKLRRLDIQGFKSFRSKTGLEIHDGVTSVVGPNGCGKSNIVDAIRWAIGSQSPKDLRGRAMEDVIFAGSEHHKPLGFAEVSLTLENDGRDVPVEWKEHAEIKVTRRLFRTGESEYEINGGRARLRDIHQLFLGTGVGAKEAYSIIEQGRIGFIVSARPEERRVIIEEAAGITRYKFQRQSAQRRLERTKDNLMRVEDVLTEVARQLSSLERQARRAARWRELTEQQRDLEIRAAHDKRTRAVEAARAVDARLAAAKQSGDITAAALAAAEAKTEALRSQQQVEEHVLGEKTEAAYAARARRDLLSNTIEHHRREREQLAERRARIVERAAFEAQRAEEAAAATSRNAEEAAAAQAALEGLDAALDADAQRLSEARALEADALSKVDAAAAELNAARAEAATARARLEAAVAETESLEQRRPEVERGESAALAASNAAQERANSARAEHALALERAAGARAAADQAGTLRAASREKVDAARRALNDARSTADAAAARVRALEGVLARGEGYGKGVRRALKAAESGTLSGIGRPVAERLRVAKPDANRLAATLGPYLDAVVADDDDSARRAIAWARSNNVRLAVCWGARRDGALVDWARAAEWVPEGVAARLVAAERTDEIVGPESGYAVSEDAAVVRPAPGLAVVGRDGGGAASVVSLASDLEEAQRAASLAAAAVPDRQAALEESERAAASADAAWSEASASADEAARLARDVGRTADDAERDVARAGRALDDVRADAARLDKRLAGLAEVADGQRAASATAEQRVAACEVAARAAREGLPELRARVATLSDALADAKAEAAAAKERANSLRVAAQQLAATADDAVRMQATLAAEEKEIAARVAKAEQSANSEERAHAESVRAADAAEVEMSAARTRYDAATTALREIEASLHAARKAHNEAARTLQGVELEAERVRAEVVHAEDGLMERFQLSVGAASEIVAGRPFGDAERAQLRDVEAKLGRLGAVNPAAEEEFAEARERHDYLTSQKDDLETAMADLEAAIRKMDKTSRELFAQTFADVDTRFRALFPRLFEGGRARLEMTDPDDVLHTGIDVIVQPPGKRLQSMTLLSGGEKALTAVSLIFAIFQLKPTPFCILDEVDAPLDDANVARFAETVREMSSTSQFLLITHNKRTMEVANTLYGVTMEEPGVSKVVGVRMPGQDERAAPVASA